LTAPRHLPADEQRELVRRAQAGDTAARDTLVETSSGIVHSLAWKFRRRNVEYADLAQEATIALIRAIDKFDVDRGSAKFSTYAITAVTRALVKFRQQSETIRPPHNRELKPGEGVVTAHLHGTQDTPEDAWIVTGDSTEPGRSTVEHYSSETTDEKLGIVAEFLDQLEDLDRLVIEYRLGLGDWEDGAHVPHSQSETSKALRMSGREVVNHERSAVARLRELVEAGA